MKGEWDKDLKSQLALLTDGEAVRIVRAGAKETGLEIWRQLAEGNDPRTEATEHNDLKQLMAWPRCEKLSGLREYISKWQDAALEYNRRAEEPVTKAQWRLGLLELLPGKLAEEMGNMRDRFDTYQKL